MSRQGYRPDRHHFTKQLPNQVSEDQFIAGSDPVSAVAGSISSIANLIGQKQQRKIISEQQQNERIKAFIEMRKNRPLMTTQQSANRQRQQKKQLHLKTILTASLILLVGLVIVVVI